MCGSGAPGTSMCGEEDDEEVISAAFCLNLEKGEDEDEAGLPPVLRGAAPASALAVREVKGRKETMVFCLLFSFFFERKRGEEGEERSERRGKKVCSNKDSTVRKRERKKKKASFGKLCYFNARPAHSHESLAVSSSPLSRLNSPARLAAKESKREK